MDPKSKIVTRLKHAGAIARYARRRFLQDQCPRVAASLSYTTLLALVPLAALAFAMLSAFPVFGDMEEQIQDFIFENFLPESIGAVQEHLNNFIDNAGGMTVAGIGGLAVTGMLLLAIIESAVNSIFRVNKKRPPAARILVFWAIITLGPLLMGASFSLSSYILSLTKTAGVEAFTGLFGRLTRTVPALIVMLAFGLFYLLAPYRRVRWRHAAVGGIVAGTLFSALRWAFGIYVIYVPTYQTIYGALAAVPIFLVWIYLSWTTVLIGAVITASLPVWNRPEGRRRLVDLEAGERLALGAGVAAALLEASRSGKGMTPPALAVATESGEPAVEAILERLRSAGYADTIGGKKWVMIRDPDSATLFDLFKALGLEADVAGQDGEQGSMPWRRRLRAITANSTGAQQELMSMSLREFFAPQLDRHPSGRDGQGWDRD